MNMKNSILKLAFIGAIALLFSSSTLAQTPNDSLSKKILKTDSVFLKGQVVDEKSEPAPFANITVKNGDGESITGVATGIGGKFSLKIPANSFEEKNFQLEVSFIGYATQNLSLAELYKQEPLVIKLTIDNEAIASRCYISCPSPFFRRNYTSTVYYSYDMQTTYRQ